MTNYLYKSQDVQQTYVVPDPPNPVYPPDPDNPSWGSDGSAPQHSGGGNYPPPGGGGAGDDEDDETLSYMLMDLDGDGVADVIIYCDGSGCHVQAIPGS